MLRFCTSRCRGTNTCEPYGQHFYTSRADPRHSKSGRTSQARFADALVRLARGQDVAPVSRGLGHASANAFTAMFRKALGKTLRDYFTHSTG